MHNPVWGKKSISTVCSHLVTYHYRTHLPRSPSRGEPLNSADTCERANLVLWRVDALLTASHKMQQNPEWLTLQMDHVSCTTEHFWLSPSISLISLLPWKDCSEWWEQWCFSLQITNSKIEGIEDKSVEKLCTMQHHYDVQGYKDRLNTL